MADRVFREERSRTWHTRAECPLAPPPGSELRAPEVPAGDELCSWCAARGSGDPTLDDRASVVLQHLRRSETLNTLGIRADRISWAFGDALFHFTGDPASGPQRVSGSVLRDVKPGALADSLIRRLARQALRRE